MGWQKIESLKKKKLHVILITLIFGYCSHEIMTQEVFWILLYQIDLAYDRHALLAYSIVIGY